MKQKSLKNKCSWLMIVLVSIVQTANAQTVLTIEDCIRNAETNYPLVRQYDLIEQSKNYSVSNIAKSYLPQVSLNSQATYQSDVTQLSLDMSSLPFDLDIPTMSKDQYRATIDVSQQIWDGGITNAKRQLIQKNSEIEKQSVEVSLHTVKTKVIQLYFSILAIEKQLGLLDLAEKNLLSSKNITQSMLDNGTAMPGDINLINVEILNIDKKKIEQNALKKAYITMLGLFINQSLTDDVSLQTPVNSQALSKEINRSELRLYDAQNSLFDIQHKLTNAHSTPKIGLFVQGGYGRPGLNMLDDNFKSFALGGIRLTWNISSFYTQKNDKRLIEQKRQSMMVQRETFLFNTNVELTQEEAEINKLKELIRKEEEIVQLRTQIKEQSESKYSNGVYQINELIRDVNSENQAMQNKALNEILYLMKIYNYNHIQGNK